MEKFNYLVKPRIPIRNVIPGQIINREKIVSLNIEQVKACLRHGPVFRKFTTGEDIQVTLDNCERLHSRDYNSKIDVKPTFIKPEEKKVEVKEETKQETVEESIVEEQVDIEEISTEEAVENDETIEGSIVEEQVEDIEEISTEEAVENDANVEAPKKQYNNNKNKKRR